MVVLAQIGSYSQWLILIVICLVVFGAKRLPDIARNLGRSLGEFRKARREFEEELMKTEKPSEEAPRLENSPVPSPSSEKVVHPTVVEDEKESH